MRHVVLFLVASLVLVEAAEAASVHWYGSIEEASTEARQANKPMMLEFWAGWCGLCEWMETEVYAKSEFVQAAGDFVAVRIDVDKKPAMATLKYKVAVLPTLLFTDSYGNELLKIDGVIALEPLTELLRSLPHDVAELNRLNGLLAQDKNNFEALNAMGKALWLAGLYRASIDYYQRALRRNEAKSNPARREVILAEMGIDYLEVKDGRQAAKVFERCLKEFPSSPHKPEWIANLMRARAMAPAKN